MALLGDAPDASAPGALLVYDLELIDVQPRMQPPAVPSDVARHPRSAQTEASGLASVVLRKGSGKMHPKPDDFVKVHYTGWTTDGKRFDSSVVRGDPTVFNLAHVIAGWQEGLSKMVVGEQRRLWIPKELAYQNRPGAPAGTLVFDVELLDIVTPEPPEDVAGPPVYAERTASGLAFTILRQGTGAEHPSPGSVVLVNYSSWTTDGKVSDTSLPLNKPAEIPINAVIVGWAEGLQLMVAGEKRRFWIPENLAQTRLSHQAPRMLVFDTELVDIKR